MKHKIIPIMAALVWGLCFFALPAYAKYGGGTGEPNDPYLIFDENQMNAIGANPADWDRRFKLMNDMDLSAYTGTAFNIIGSYSYPFTGVFDGNGHTISNFTYASTGTSNVGLFRYVNGPNTEIKNLGLIEPDVDAGTGWTTWYVGLLVGWLRAGTITGCYVEGGDVSGQYSVGGLVGESDGGITNCHSEASVEGTDHVGGLVGHNNYLNATITNSYSTGTILGDDRVGGLVGSNNGIITNCYSTGNISGDCFIGGLIGKNYSGTITNCYATGSVSGNYRVGGLVGYSYGEVYASFWDIETSGQSTSAGGTDLTTAEMQMASTFTNAGWDFNTPVWTIDEGVDYPRLWWEFVPVLHAEPEMTLGINNRISWEPLLGDFEYYAECAEDANFTSILYGTGWITETSCEFTNLYLGQQYWYSVKARNAAGTETDWSNVVSSLQVTLADAVDVMLEPESLKNENMKNALLNKIDAAMNMIEEANYAGALSKLQNDILAKMNGCSETGQPDKNDWIITCDQQCEIYPLVIETIEQVRVLMGE